MPVYMNIVSVALTSYCCILSSGTAIPVCAVVVKDHDPNPVHDISQGFDSVWHYNKLEK